MNTLNSLSSPCVGCRGQRMNAQLNPLKAELKSAGIIGHDEYVLSGSVVMALHGLDVKPGDVDMFVSERLYQILKARGWTELRPGPPHHPPMLEWHCGKLQVHCWYVWDDEHHIPGDGDEVVRHAFESMEVVQTWPCMSLKLLRHWKMWVAPMVPKHFAHIEMIDTYLNVTEWMESPKFTLEQALWMMSTYTFGYTDYDFLRPLYFMLDDSRSISNETGWSWEWVEAQYRRLQRAGLVWKRPMEHRRWSVWDLTEYGARVVESGLELEDSAATRLAA